MLVVDGQIVTCEEYLYWVDYVCTYLASQLPDVDWNAAVSEGGITYGDYVKLEAVNAAKRFAVTRAWAEQAGIALTDGEMAALALQRQELVSLYGEEGYQQQLALMGISEETFDGMLAAQYLNSSLQTAYGPGGSMYDEDAVRAYAQEQGYASVYVLTLTGESAGLPYSVPAYTVGMVCGSGMKSVIEAGRAILAGDADIVVCGGTENMSAAPYCGWTPAGAPAWATRSLSTP